MRKRITPSTPQESTAAAGGWLDLDELAQVEVTSEDPDHSVESALVPGTGPGWRAGGPGEQTIRLVFDEPQRLSRILLEFVETAIERTQEYVLRCSDDGGATYREVLRQQWNFSPAGATTQIQDQSVDLANVTGLELTVVPDISGGAARATLAQLRIA